MQELKPKKIFFCRLNTLKKNGIFLILLFSLVFPFELLTSYEFATIHSSQSSNNSYIQKLMNQTPQLLSQFPAFKVSDVSLDRKEADFYKPGECLIPNIFSIPLPYFDIQEQDDVVLNGSYPKAMELDASSMTFTLFFTIVNSTGNSFEFAFKSLEISNSTDVFRISKTAIFGWVNYGLTDYYSLKFPLNNSFLSQITIGIYNLTLTTDIYSHISSDSIILPMKDLQVSITGSPPTEFNNKLDADQIFNLTTSVNEIRPLSGGGSALFPVESLPWIDNGEGDNINPNLTLISETGNEVNTLDFLDFISNESISGSYTFNFSIPATIAPLYENGIHTLHITITSPEGIKQNTSIIIEAKGTVYLVEVVSVTIGTNTPLEWDNLTNGGDNHIDIRVNLNDNIDIAYRVLDGETRSLVDPPERVAGQLVAYQDPNKIGEIAIKYVIIGSDATGVVHLTANVLTLASGYELLLYVRGHRTSQIADIDTYPNMTIYWDALEFEYEYWDQQGNFGSRVQPNTKALGVNVGTWWILNLSVFYASDGTPAKGCQISYQINGFQWINLTDGKNGDVINGFFLFNYTYFTPSNPSELFEFKIVNGSIYDPMGTYFVNTTFTSSSFELDVVWTYLIINLIPGEPDQRLGVRKVTNISIEATWAHDITLPFNGIITGKDWLGNPRDLSLINGQGIWTSISQSNMGRYSYEIVQIQDSLFGVTSFLNNTLGDVVKIYFIWEELYFTFSPTYNELIDPSLQGFSSSIEYFVNYGENAILYIYGIHTYDNAPFQGIALLFDSFEVKNYTVSFNEKGIGIRDDLNFSYALDKVSFFILDIQSSGIEDWGITAISGGFSGATISWDKIVVTLSGNMWYSHGTWADIYLSFEYLVYNTIDVNLSTLTYNLLLSNGTLFSGISWTHFRDFSIGPTIRSYNITSLYDSSTGLFGFVTQFIWIDDSIEPRAGNLTTCWLDTEDPQILEWGVYDKFGNGTILIYVDVSDNSETWIGTEISKVLLKDLREGIEEYFPHNPTAINLGNGITRYLFHYNYLQVVTEFDPPDYFQFNYGEILIFSVSITDTGTPNYPAWLGDLRSNHTISSPSFQIQVNYDIRTPIIIEQNGVPFQLIYSNDIEGRLEVSVMAQDQLWSGLNEESAVLVITDLQGEVIVNKTMTVQPGFTSSLTLSQIRFNSLIELNVFETYLFTVIITDNAGNKFSSSLITEIADAAAPRIVELILNMTSDRKLNITVYVEDFSSAIAFIRVQISRDITFDDSDPWFDLSRSGGAGSAINQLSQLKYTRIIPLSVSLIDLILPPDIYIRIKTRDGTGNERIFSLNDNPNLVWNINPGGIIFRSEVLIVGALVLLMSIIVGIRVLSRTEGYDMKKIITESERISREVMLTLMDEFALGVTVNFFDQVQGPVPVIWEPALLEDQEQVMLDLSDKSFSTLEFVGLEEKERSGTFDFSTGSYECTALGYSFAIDNPQARGGKENLTVVLLLRKEWGDNLLVFQDELVEKLREIRDLIVSQQTSNLIEKKARDLREFVSRLMISFNKLYTGIDYETDLQVE